MQGIKTKDEALKVLSEIDENTLIRIAGFSKNEKALSFFKSTIKFTALKTFLGS